MKIIEPSIEVLTPINEDLLKLIEIAGRTCYRSEKRIVENSAEAFVHVLISRGHEAVLEHASVSIRITCDRGVTHEIVRHRIASYAQESTRYCNYENAKFGSEIKVIRPSFWMIGTEEYKTWCDACSAAEKSYFHLLDIGASPQEARSVLPNSLATQIVVTMNLREWRHFIKLRCSPEAHPQMREIAREILYIFRTHLPVIVEDINYI